MVDFFTDIIYSFVPSALFSSYILPIFYFAFAVTIVCLVKSIFIRS